MRCWERGRLVRTERKTRKFLDRLTSVLGTLCGRDVRAPGEKEQKMFYLLMDAEAAKAAGAADGVKVEVVVEPYAE